MFVVVGLTRPLEGGTKPAACAMQAAACSDLTDPEHRSDLTRRQLLPARQTQDLLILWPQPLERRTDTPVRGAGAGTV